MATPIPVKVQVIYIQCSQCKGVGTVGITSNGTVIEVTCPGCAGSKEVQFGRIGDAP